MVLRANPPQSPDANPYLHVPQVAPAATQGIEPEEREEIAVSMLAEDREFRRYVRRRRRTDEAPREAAALPGAAARQRAAQRRRRRLLFPGDWEPGGGGRAGAALGPIGTNSAYPPFPRPLSPEGLAKRNLGFSDPQYKSPSRRRPGSCPPSAQVHPSPPSAPPGRLPPLQSQTRSPSPERVGSADEAAPEEAGFALFEGDSLMPVPLEVRELFLTDDVARGAKSPSPEPDAELSPREPPEPSECVVGSTWPAWTGEEVPPGCADDEPESVWHCDVDSGEWCRNWTTEQLRIVRMPFDTPAEAELRHAAMQHLRDAFVRQAVPIAANVIEAQMCAPPTGLPDPLPGGGLHYRIRGIVFTLVDADEQIREHGSAAAAAKAAAAELRCIDGLAQVGLPEIPPPLHLLITYLGRRVWAKPIVCSPTPPGDSPCHDSVNLAARVLNLGPPRTAGVLLVEHAASPGQYFVSTASGLIPKDSSGKGTLRREHILLLRNLVTGPASVADASRILRTEHLQRIASEIAQRLFFATDENNCLELESADADKGPREAADGAVRRLGELPGYYVKALRAALRRPPPVTAALHEAGIPLRLLGHLLEAFLQATSAKGADSTQPCATALVVEMIARAFKRVMRRRYSEAPAAGLHRDAMVLASHELTIVAFNRLLHGGAASRQFWNEELLPELRAAFDVSDELHAKIKHAVPFLTEGSGPHLGAPDGLLSPSFFYQIFCRACALVGAWFRADEQSTLLSLGQGGALPFDAQNFTALRPVVKDMPASPFTEAQALDRRGLVDQAILACEGELRHRRRIDGDSPKLVPLLDALAQLYRRRSRVPDVIRSRRTIVRIFQARAALGQPDAAAAHADSLDRLGVDLEENAKLDDALQAYYTAERVRARAGHALLRERARSQLNLARLLAHLGHYQEAVRRAQEGEGELTAVGTEEDVADALDTAADVAQQLGRWEQAAEWGDRALAIRRKKQRPTDLGLARCELQKAAVLMQERKYDGALLVADSLLRRSKAADWSVSDIGTEAAIMKCRALRLSGRFRQGHQLCEHALSTAQRRSGGPGDRVVSLLLVELSYYCFHPEADDVNSGPQNTRTKRALSHLRQAAHKLSRWHGHLHQPVLATILTQLAHCHRLLGQQTAALAMAETAVSLCKALRLDDERARAALVAAGQLHLLAGEQQKAVQLFYKALALARQGGNRPHDDYAAVRCLQVCFSELRMLSPPPSMPHDARLRSIEDRCHLATYQAFSGSIQGALLSLKAAVLEYQSVFPSVPGARYDPSCYRVLQPMRALCSRLLGLPADVGIRAAIEDWAGPEGVVDELYATAEKLKARAEKGARLAPIESACASTRLAAAVRQFEMLCLLRKFGDALPIYESIALTWRSVFPAEATEESIGLYRRVDVPFRGMRRLMVLERCDHLIGHLLQKSNDVFAPERAVVCADGPETGEPVTQDESSEASTRTL